MKKYLLVLLIFYVAQAQANYIMSTVTAGGCADCSGDEKLIWECNSTTVGDAGFSPCGCSDGDTSVTLNGNAAVSSGLLTLNDTSANGADYATLTVSSGDLCGSSEGTVWIRFRVNTWKNSWVLFRLLGSTDEQIYIALTGDNDLIAQFVHSGGTYDSAGLSGNNVSTGAWYVVRYRYKVGRATADQEITLYNAAMTELESNPDLDAIATLAVAPGAEDFQCGNSSGGVTGQNVDIEYVHTYGTWRNDDPNA